MIHRNLNADAQSAEGMSRRQFMQTASMAASAALLAANLESLGIAAENRGSMPYRMLGRTGEKVSIIGVGGFHAGKPKEESESINIIRGAIDGGVNFMDNCWDYNNGVSEERMGKALRDGYREKVFLMTKVDGRSKKLAAQQIDESLKRLQTDHVDLLQFHEVIRMEDPDRFFAEGGALEAFQEARKAGKLRFIGFTGHKDPAIHLRMLDLADEHQFRFDTVQMPLNVMDAHFRSFGRQVVPRLVKANIGILGMKPLGSGIILQSNTVSAIECLHYAMSLPVATVITGMDKMEIMRQALEAARTFKPMNEPQVAALLERTKEAAAHGKYELFKTATRFDATAQNPKWIG